ncbi:MAG: hypothetical protein M5U12_11385 [Verrucomicrobia bacterium]|nr:hypothetical protein [Verrucomicrobiota bacterium]
MPAPPGTNSLCLFAVFRTSQAHDSDPEGGGVAGTSGQRDLFGARHGGDTKADSPPSMSRAPSPASAASQPAAR